MLHFLFLDFFHSANFKSQQFSVCYVLCVPFKGPLKNACSFCKVGTENSHFTYLIVLIVRIKHLNMIHVLKIDSVTDHFFPPSIE